ncbi:MAG TPA: PD-(D/E)XK nuclease family protein [Candidatus Saccharimonadales bacterium]|nr:PD-(D/E)XK nuclease family protein [Candidatus Saccharimonadales bacterium]
MRERSLPYKPGQTAPYRVSRSKIDLFLNCPRCFWLDARLKIKRPSSPPFRINSAIDELYKKEFDVHRETQTAHPICETYGLKLVPFKHEKMDEWRDALRRGVTFLHEPTNLLITGGVDDIWVDLETDELVVVDYKATAKAGEVSLDAGWQIGYKRQIEVYQWLLRSNAFKVKNVGYFLYTNARLDADKFGDKLEFKTKLLDYEGDDSWVEQTIFKMKECLDSDDMPEVGKNVMDPSKPCEFCDYARSRTMLTVEALQKKSAKPKSAKKVASKT